MNNFLQTTKIQKFTSQDCFSILYFQKNYDNIIRNLLHFFIFLLMIGTLCSCSGDKSEGGKNFSQNNMEGQKISDPNFPFIQLPFEYTSQRTTKRFNPEAGEEVEILNVKGPGCIRHFWITTGTTKESKNHQLQIKIFYDNSIEPQVDMKLNNFFAILLREQPYRVESAPIKVLPASALNSYFPIPFQRSCKIVLVNNGNERPPVWSMVNWHSYAKNTIITPYRLNTIYSKKIPEEEFGSHKIGDITGQGFVAGIVMGIKRTDFGDMIYHTGGDTWLIDGETNPHVLRGIGIEDLFTQSFGFNLDNSQWSGCPYNDTNGSNCSEGVVYRFFGMDAVKFKSSLSLRMGNRLNQYESVLYYYLDSRKGNTPDIIVPVNWKLLGPFDCRSFSDFEKKEFPEKSDNKYPDSIQWGRRSLVQPTDIKSEHTWIDFARVFRRNMGGNVGTQPVDAAAYALTDINIESYGKFILNIGFDDWIKVWINEEFIASFKNDSGFDTIEVPVFLKKGKNRLMIKLSNKDNIEWRCWAFSCKFKKPD
jgi:hypothetical protein